MKKVTYNPRFGKRGRNNPIASPEQFRLAEASAKGVKTSMPMKVAKELLAKTSKAMKKKFARMNPNSAEAMAEAFHGRQPLEEIDIVEAQSYDEKLAVIGLLEELEVLTSDCTSVIPINFPHYDHRSAFSRMGVKKDTVYVCCNASGTDIYFVGGDQCIPVKAITQDPKRLVLVGECYSITYWTDKYHLTDGTGFSSYCHQFGEEGGVRPKLMYDCVDKKLSLLGGSYTVVDTGIKD